MTEKFNSTAQKYWGVIVILVSIMTFVMGQQSVSGDLNRTNIRVAALEEQCRANDQNIREVRQDLKDIKTLLIDMGRK